jgi:hypothetical protein
MRMGSALLVCGLASGGAQAQAARATCDVAEYRQFDFWIGTWTVRTANGTVAGTNRIEPILGGCALLESWTANGPSRGRSLNSYDRGSGTWHQAWVDNAGTVLLLSGGLVNGEMVLEGERTLRDGTVQLERITWTPNSDGTVRQLWQASLSRGMRWTVVFDGTYTKAG